MSDKVINPSPSRTYVIRLNKSGFTGFFFKKFTLPENMANTCEFATWYFYNTLDSFSCGESAFPIEDYHNLIEIPLK